MSSAENTEVKKNTSITRLVIILVVGLLVGGGAIYLAAPSLVSPSTTTQTTTQVSTEVATQTVTTGTTVVSIGTTMSTQTTTVTSTYTATAPANVITTVTSQSTGAPPTGWETAQAVKMGTYLEAEFTNSSSGPSAWNATLHPHIFVTTNGLAACAVNKICSPGLAIIDANTWQVILTRQYQISGVTNYNEDHDIGVSMNGQYIYLGSADNSNPVAAKRGFLLIIDARTLQVHQVLNTWGSPHHERAFTLWNGEDVEGLDNFYLTSYGSQTDNSTLGQSAIIMDSEHDNVILGGVTPAMVDGNPHKISADPNGQELFVYVDIMGATEGKVNLVGAMPSGGKIVVVNMTNWHMITSYLVASQEPTWGVTTQNGKYTYVNDGTGDVVYKLDNVQQAVVGQSRCACLGGYGDLLSYNEQTLYIASKGEGDGGHGAQIGIVNPTSMTPSSTVNIASVEPDHLVMDPWDTNLLVAGSNGYYPWAPYFQDTVWNMSSQQTVAVVTQTGSSHPGEFVQYTVNADGSWTGQLMSDNQGLHGSALQAQVKALGVTVVYYGSHTYPYVQH